MFAKEVLPVLPSDRWSEANRLIDAHFVPIAPRGFYNDPVTYNVAHSVDACYDVMVLAQPDQIIPLYTLDVRDLTNGTLTDTAFYLSYLVNISSFLSQFYG